MGPDEEVVSTANLLNSDDLSALYSVKAAAVLGLSQVAILIAIVFGCHACYRNRRYRHKRRGRRTETSSEDSKDSSNGQAQAQPIFLDASNTTLPFQAPSPPQGGSYGAVQSGPYVMNMAPAPYAPSAPYVPVMPSTSFAAGVPTSQQRNKQQSPFVPQAQPEDLPPAYHTVFPEKKS